MTVQQRLYDKLDAEFQAFIEKLNKLSTDKLIDAAYEKVIKEDILSFFSGNSYSDEKVEVLLKLDYPLDTLYQEWMDADVSYMDLLRESIDNKVDSILDAENKLETLDIPVGTKKLSEIRKSSGQTTSKKKGSIGQRLKEGSEKSKVQKTTPVKPKNQNKEI